MDAGQGLKADGETAPRALDPNVKGWLRSLLDGRVRSGSDRLESSAEGCVRKSRGKNAPKRVPVLAVKERKVNAGQW